MTIKQKTDDLLKRCLFGKLADRIATVEEFTVVAVDLLIRVSAMVIPRSPMFWSLLISCFVTSEDVSLHYS